MWQVLVYLVFRQTVARCKQPVIQYSVTTTTAVAQVARLIVGVRKLGLVVNVCGFRFTQIHCQFAPGRVRNGAAAGLPRLRTMDESMESKNALWRREDQLRCWNTSETNSASATPRDRQLSAVKFHDGCVFLAACSSGDTKEVTWLLGRGADINTANVDGLTALHQVS